MSTGAGTGADVDDGTSVDGVASDPLERVRAALAWLRDGPAADWVTVAAFVLGTALGSLHWAGLAVGGALVGVVAPTLTRAFQLGLYLGGTVLLLFYLYLLLVGSLGTYAAMGQVVWLNVAITLGLPTLAAGVRGLG